MKALLMPSCYPPTPYFTFSWTKTTKNLINKYCQIWENIVGYRHQTQQMNTKIEHYIIIFHNL